MRDQWFEWDDDKAWINLEKHDVSFELARCVFDDPNLDERLDDDPDEERWAATGMAKDQVLVVIYVERAGRTRIISARRASKHEQARYFAGL